MGVECQHEPWGFMALCAKVCVEKEGNGLHELLLLEALEPKMVMHMQVRLRKQSGNMCLIMLESRSFLI